MSDTLDQTQSEFWREVRPKSVITINDEQALIASLDSDKGLVGEEFFVKWVQNIREQSNLVEWLYFCLENNSEEVYLLVTIVDNEEPDLAIFFDAGGWESCNRSEVIDKDQEFIFEAPDDEENFDFLGLKYASSFEWELVNDDDSVTNARYDLVSPYPLQSWTHQNPPDADRLLTTIAYYKSKTEGAHSPLALILEMGHPDNENGGLIKVYLGSPIRASEMTVLKI